MQFTNYLKSKLSFYVALSLTFIFASCGSYQYVGYDNDGVYGSEDVVYEQRSYNEVPSNNNSSYYKNYFAEKSREFENVQQDVDIFTDIDSYEGDYNELEDSTYVSGYAGWGQDNDDVTINVYSNFGFNNWWYRPYNRWSWYRPYYNWGWDYYGFGLDPYWYSPYYNGFRFYGGLGFYGGFGYHSPYWYYNRPYWNGYRNHYYNGFYGSRNIAYNAGRRGSISNYSSNRTSSINNRNLTSLNRRSSTLNRRSSTLSNNNRTDFRSRSGVNSNTIRRGQNSTIRRNNNSTFRPRVNNGNRPRINNGSRSNAVNRSYSSPRRSNNSPSFSRSSSRSNSSSSNYSRSSSRSSSNNSVRSSSNNSSRSSSNNSSRSSGSRRGNQ